MGDLGLEGARAGLEAAELAWKKGGLKKPGKTALFLSTANFEQRNYERALEFLAIAEKSPDNEPREIERVKRIVNEAVEIIRNRSTEAAATQAAPKS